MIEKAHVCSDGDWIDCGNWTASSIVDMHVVFFDKPGGTGEQSFERNAEGIWSFSTERDSGTASVFYSIFLQRRVL